jgi:hypothetical protein
MANENYQNEFTEMVQFLQNHYQRKRGLMKKFDDEPASKTYEAKTELSALGKMLLDAA